MQNDENVHWQEDFCDIYELPKRLASSNDFLNTSDQCVPVFIKVRAISTRHRYEENQPTEQYYEITAKSLSIDRRKVSLFFTSF